MTPNAKMEDLVKEGDELDLVVVKTNDQEGVDTLSRVRFEAQKGMKDVSEAAENGTVMGRRRHGGQQGRRCCQRQGRPRLCSPFSGHHAP